MLAAVARAPEGLHELGCQNKPSLKPNLALLVHLGVTGKKR